MLNKCLLLLLIIGVTITGNAKTWIVSNAGSTFSPDTLTINEGDSVNFIIASQHSVIEVTEATWNANGNTSSGGFQLPLGGGLILPAELNLGTHWYVCGPHASSGMKAVIIVDPALKINDELIKENIEIFPNPFDNHFSLKVDRNLLGENYSLLNITGKVITSGQVNQLLTEIQVDHLPSGYYFLQIGTINRQTYRIVKE